MRRLLAARPGDLCLKSVAADLKQSSGDERLAKAGVS
jgi:hypothetical protein